LRLRFLSGVPLAAAILALAFGAGAQGQSRKPLDAGDVADGMRLFQQKATASHVTAGPGDGRKTEQRRLPDGPNLRDNKPQPRPVWC